MTLMLSKENYARAKSFLQTRGRAIDQARLQYELHNGSREAVMDALAAHQNADGGFQAMCEGPRDASSPIGTSVAFQLIAEMNVPNSEPMVKRAVGYLLDTYDEAAGMWQPAYNWRFEGDGQIQNWGNPSAELTGYLYRYRDQVPPAFLQQCLDQVEKNLAAVKRPMDPFSLLCYMRFTHFAPEPLKSLVIQRLREDVPLVIERDPAKWPNWCTKPYWFAISPSSPVNGIIRDDVQASLEFEIRNQADEGYFPPHWSDTDENLEGWRSVLTVDVLKALHRRNLIER
ncbi:hypothetical protein GXP70_21860 [Paenibacillus lycopersici]|uniref:Uncharacterized protein n=1 Tax=Paenibacillus lycopersici TaxID=2704462 RepID=A0A6C0G4G2_9BACL|nr:hypothetical protein [Paenibacillus lycopersici]QHT62364.1 hypothetical protein GXP70_21860 [Paenibacillus lycopersici]